MNKLNKKVLLGIAAGLGLFFVLLRMVEGMESVTPHYPEFDSISIINNLKYDIKVLIESQFESKFSKLELVVNAGETKSVLEHGNINDASVGIESTNENQNLNFQSDPNNRILELNHTNPRTLKFSVMNSTITANIKLEKGTTSLVIIIGSENENLKFQDKSKDKDNSNTLSTGRVKLK